MTKQRITLAFIFICFVSFLYHAYNYLIIRINLLDTISKVITKITGKYTKPMFTTVDYLYLAIFVLFCGFMIFYLSREMIKNKQSSLKDSIFLKSIQKDAFYRLRKVVPFTIIITTIITSVNLRMIYCLFKVMSSPRPIPMSDFGLNEFLTVFFRGF